MRMSGIPVKHYGIQIGTASIADSGKISVELDSSEEFGQALLESIAKGSVTGLELKPIMPPAKPATQSGPVDAVGSYSNVTGVQFGHGNTQTNQF